MNWIFPIAQLPLQNNLILARAGMHLLQRTEGWVLGWGHCREVLENNALEGRKRGHGQILDSVFRS